MKTSITRTALVVGTGSGISASFTRQLAKVGYRVALASRDRKAHTANRRHQLRDRGSEMLDPTGLELDETRAHDVFLSGQGVFTPNVGNVMPRANNSQHSKRAGDIKMTKFPGLADVGKGPMGWSRRYCISSKTKMKNEAWRVIHYMGGKDAEGRYYTARTYGVGYAFKSMDSDPDLVAAQKAASHEPDIRAQQYATAKARDNIA